MRFTLQSEQAYIRLHIKLFYDNEPECRLNILSGSLSFCAVLHKLVLP